MKQYEIAWNNTKSTLLDLFKNKKTKEWGEKFLYSIIDQSIYAGGNFIASFLLARWLTESNYGSYSVVFSIFMFLTGFPSALVWEPMAVYCAKYQDSIDDYLRKQFFLHLQITFLITGVFVFLSLFFSGYIQTVIFFASISMPFILLVWYSRRISYIKAEPRFAIIISLVNEIILITSLFSLHISGNLTAGYAFGAMALASSGAFVIGQSLLKIPIQRSVFIQKALFFENWSYGKHLIVVSILSNITSLAYIPMLGALVGLVEAGAYRAMQNLILPIQQVIVAISLFFLPQLSIITDKHGIKPAKRIINFLIVFVGIIIVGYFLSIDLYKNQLINLLYQKPSLLSYTWLIPWLAIAFAFSSISQLIEVAMRAFKRPLSILYAKAIAVSSVILLGIYATYRWHLNGIVISILFSSILECCVFIYLYITQAKD